MVDKNDSKLSEDFTDKLLLKFPMLGKKLKGFALAAESGSFGEVDVEMNPDNLNSMLSGSFSCAYRWLGFIHIAILYEIKVDTTGPVTVQGALAKDKIRGDVLIFGYNGSLLTDLDPFAIEVIRSNLELYCRDENINFVQLRNVTLKQDYSSVLDDCES